MHPATPTRADGPARRVAEEIGVELGEDAGHKIRGDQIFNKNQRLM